MSIRKEYFGKTKDGQEIHRYFLNEQGPLCVCVMDYGATIQQMHFNGVDNVILGYDTLADYEEQDGSYQGATIGRFGNRIANGRFLLNGKEYVLACNEAGRGHLHGGNKGFDKAVWQVGILSEGEEPSIRFSHTSPDGEEGYPGTLHVSVTMTVVEGCAIKIEYEARSDADTVLNLTNHSYFNLNGAAGGNVLDTELMINAAAITPVDEKLIPTGELMPVEGTPFDFRTPKAIGKEIDSQHPQMLLGGGYDHNFMLEPAPAGETLRHAVTACSPKTGIQLDCYTDQPAVQVYTANFLKETAGVNGTPLYRHQGFCLETQHVPDSPNQPQFPTTVLKANETFSSVTVYRFSQKA